MARRSAQEFVASVLIDALDASAVPIESNLSACISFYYHELDEKKRDPKAEVAEDEIVKL